MRRAILLLAVPMVLVPVCAAMAAAPPPRGGDRVVERICSHEQARDQVTATSREPVADPVRPRVTPSAGRDSYTFAELNALSYPDLIDLVVTLDWWDIEGIFEFSPDSHAFFADVDRVMALIDALEARGALYTTSDDFGCYTLVEVIRSGFYLGFYYEELSYLDTESFKENCWPALHSMADNPVFGLGTYTQDRVAGATGALMGIGSAPVDIIAKVVPVFADFNANAAAYLFSWDKRNALYRLGSGIDYALVSTYLYHHPDPLASPYYGQVDAYFDEVADLAVFGVLDEDYTWLINNAVWWTGRIGQFVAPPAPVQALTDVIDVYGHWPMPSLQAAELIVWYHDGVDAHGQVVDMHEIKVELRALLLPERYVFDEGSIVFDCGGQVDPQKVERLYWAIKEVKAQFHRLITSDAPLDPAHADSVLTAVVYDSPSDYDYNRFLYGLSTDNGGIYIESWGTFFTYERTPVQSIYTLEDLFRHEYVHYLQGRYLEPGQWWEHPIYDGERLTWFDEGQAEFMAGSSRDQGVRTRRSMAEGVAAAPGDRMTLAEVLHATYSSGWEFYTYGFAFFDYMYAQRPDIMADMFDLVAAGDGLGFDLLVAYLEGDAALETAYQSHMDDLVANAGTFVDPVTSDDYLAPIPSRDPDAVYADIAVLAGLADTTSVTIVSASHAIYEFRGTRTGPASAGEVADRADMDAAMDLALDQLDDAPWPGYLTVTCYFTDYRLDPFDAYEYDVVFVGVLPDDFPTDVEGDVAAAPSVLALRPCYPNPFNPVTTLRFELARTARVDVGVYDLAGRRVRSLAGGPREPGAHAVVWRGLDDLGRPVGAGAYVIRLEAGGQVRSTRVTLVK